MPTQNVNLTAELESFVKDQVNSGFFNNASEVHRAALAAMCKSEEERKAKIERLGVEIKKGMDSLSDGDVLHTKSEIRSAIGSSLKSVLSRKVEAV